MQANESMSQQVCFEDCIFKCLPHAKELVRVVREDVLDVAVDLRVGSPTFGQHPHAALLTGKTNGSSTFRRGCWFVAWDVRCFIICTAIMSPGSEQALLWNDPDLGDGWGMKDPKSVKDASAQCCEVSGHFAI